MSVEEAPAFWAWLAEHEADLNGLDDSSDPFWDEIVSRLKSLDDRLWLQVSAPDDEREFIVTAEGDVAAFPSAEAVIAEAPSLTGWRFLALRPAMGFDFTLTYEDYRFDPAEMWFTPLETAEPSQEFAIRVAVPLLTGYQTMCAVSLILSTALGERLAAGVVGCIALCPLADMVETDGWLPLKSLPQSIESFLNRQPGDA